MSFEGIHLSVIVPVYNEEGAVAGLYHEILEMCRRMNADFGGVGMGFEIIFVNDGSSDRTLEVLQTLNPIKIVNLRRNFGQTAAMDAGIKAARGRYIATLDGDGQNNPADIPKLLEKLQREDLDVVNGWRKHRQDKKSKRWASLAAAFIRRRLVKDGIHDSGCSLKVYRRECFDRVNLYGEMHRFIPAILKIKGYRIGEEVVDHRPRTTGSTKYNWKRGVKGILDMFSVWFWHKYAARPLHLFGGAGIAMMTVSGIAGMIALYKKFFTFQDLSNSAMTNLSMFGFFIGLLLFVFGLISDMLTKIYFGATNDRPYDIREVIERPSPDGL